MIETGTKQGVEGVPVEIRAPLVTSSKADIVRRGVSLGVPFEHTLSCYDPVENDGIWRVSLAGGSPQRVRRLDAELQDLYLHSLGIGRAGSPLMLFLYRYTGELYALEPPTR